MNPVDSLAKCALRLAVATAIVGTLMFAAACNFGGGGNGGGGGGGGGNGNFSKASLKGQYLIALTGIAVDQPPLVNVDPFSETIVLTADGNGNLTITVDDFDQTGLTFALPNNTTLSGTYVINKNGTGVLQFNSSTYGITMIDDSHFYLIQGDLFATASGLGEKQDTTAFSTVPSGTFIFQAHDLSSSSRVGSMTVTSGTINALQDFLFLGSTLPNGPTAITGSFASSPDADGRGQFSLSDGSTFAYYMVNASKFRFMFFSNSSSTLEIGQAEKQTGGPFSTASLGSNSYVFGSSGDTISNSIAIHSAGVLTTDGIGNLGGMVDWVQDTAINSGIALNNTSSYSLDTDGRGVFNLDLSNGFVGQKVFWMVSPTRAYVLTNSSVAIEDGTLTKQQGAPFSNSSMGAQSAFFMDGFDVAYKDRSGVITPNGSGTFQWNQQANSFDINLLGSPSATTTNGTYQVDSSGRVTVVVNNVTSSIVFYLSSSNSGYMVQEDGADIGGAFQAQATQ